MEAAERPVEREPLNLLCGIGPKHIRRLAESTWNGGLGMSMKDISDLTLDQVFLLLCDIDNLRGGPSGRARSLPAEQAAVGADEDGQLWGRDEEGNRFKGFIAGESLCSRITREKAEEARKRNEAKKKRRGKT